MLRLTQSLTVWDSRLIHWNSSPVAEQTRFATYVCYCPRSLMSEEALARKLQVFKDRKGTTHWPVRSTPSPPTCYTYIQVTARQLGPLGNTNASLTQQQNVVPVDRVNSKYAIPHRPDDTPDPANRSRPFVEPEETPTVLKLVGVRG